MDQREERLIAELAEVKSKIEDLKSRCQEIDHLRTLNRLEENANAISRMIERIRMKNMSYNEVIF